MKKLSDGFNLCAGCKPPPAPVKCESHDWMESGSDPYNYFCYHCGMKISKAHFMIWRKQ